jgi:hypothetical protein
LVPKDKSFPSFEEASSNLIEITNLHEAVKLPLKEREFFSENDVLEQKEDITRQTNLVE